MNEINKVLEFLDGDLGQMEERELFLNLSENEALRTQMRQIYSVNYSLNRNRNYFSPSAESTMGLFGKLGFSGKYLDNKDSKRPGIMPWFFDNLLNKSALIGAIIAFLATSAGFILFDYLNSKDSAPEAKYAAHSIFDNNDFAGNNKVAESIVTKELNQKQEQPIVKYVYLTKESGNDNKNNLTEKNIENKNLEQENSLVKPEQKPDTIDKNTEPESKPLIIKPEQDNHDLLPDLAEAKKDYKYEIEYRGAYYRNLPKETIQPSQLAYFDNYSLAFLFKLYDGLYVGPEIRQEKFFQEFKDFTDFGMPATYQQQPNFTTLNLMLRYSSSKVIGINPMVQVETGYARTGWVNRIAAGFGINLSDNLEIIALGEYSHFLFNNNNSIYNTQKIGILYGLNYKF